MAKAGDRYDTLTGNIWAYSQRGDLTGTRAALARGVDVNIVNIAGWTAAHAAASTGQVRVLTALLRAGADITIRDRGGNLALHEAARNGHAHAVEALVNAGAKLEDVRLSQTKGSAVRAMVIAAYRRAGKPDGGDDDELAAAVGRDRKQVKSNAFFGPRRAPISCKIKREILKRRRARGGGPEPEDAAEPARDDGPACGDGGEGGDEERAEQRAEPRAAVPSRGEAVRAAKATAKQSRRARRAKARDGAAAESDEAEPERARSAEPESEPAAQDEDVGALTLRFDLLDEGSSDCSSSEGA